MRYLFLSLLVIVSALPIMGQGSGGSSGNSEENQGSISFITSQSVYVRFNSMKGISEGDTLYIKQGETYIPALKIKNLSSISCVCTPLVSREFNVSDAVYARLNYKETTGPDIMPATSSLSADTVSIVSEPGSDSITVSSMPADPVPADTSERERPEQEIRGRISVSSYSNFSSRGTSRQRMRYTFSMNANNLGSSGLSAETYLSFAHSNTNWEAIQENVFVGLKVYALSLKYDFNETMYLSAGRKINPMLSSVGAIDGLQFQKKIKSITLGAIAGTRPDYTDYSFNPDLLQYGAYVGHDLQKAKLSMQNSLAFIEQTNSSQTDRRFIYFQHSSRIMKNLSLFGSAEMDLYQKLNEKEENVFNLSNVYLSLRYRIIRPLSVGISYSSRQNIIYYETYKDFVERLIENEALQGWRLRINARPAKNFVMGVSTGYRYRKEDPQPAKNIYGYATYSRIPGVHASMTVSATWLESSYLSGNIYSVGLSKDLLAGKLSGGLKYRYVDYLYRNTETGQPQNVFEANLSWNIFRKLSFSVYYEGSLESDLTYNRLYINLSQRF